MWNECGGNWQLLVERQSIPAGDPLRSPTVADKDCLFDQHTEAFRRLSQVATFIIVTVSFDASMDNRHGSRNISIFLTSISIEN